MTLSAFHRKAKQHSTMDYAPSPESFYAPESYKSGDFSAFAASPNSLYMYDQELHDMQNTLNNGMFCGQGGATSDSLSTVGTEGDFDLDPFYENSNSLEGYLTAEAGSNPLVGSVQCTQVSSASVMPSQKMSVLTTLTPKKEGPTLTELNTTLSMEDIDSLLEDEVKSAQFAQGRCSTVPQLCELLKPPVTCAQTVRTADPQAKPSYLTLGRYTGVVSQTNSSRPQFTPTTSRVGPRVPPVSPHNVAVVPPIPVTSIKTEPVETDEKISLHKLLSSPRKSTTSPPTTTTTASSTAAAAKRVMPVVGQKRPPPLQHVKSESVEEKWKEIEKFIHDPDEPSPTKKRRHGSGSSAALSDDEDAGGMDMFGNDSDDSDSDAESDVSDTPMDESLTEMAKKSKQYFWQYNVQAKGPKGTRLKLSLSDDDPHHPSNFEDPVFDANSTSLVGIRHGGKARKGDGNEVTPNPRKLCNIGRQLYKLNRQINSFNAASDQPASVRNKSRKEKNKLASRACRLKKKAQHEANKIKLKGLGSEQGELLEVITQIWPMLKERAKQQMKRGTPTEGKSSSLTQLFTSAFTSQRKTFIAGSTTDFVNEVIAKVEDGDPTGGLPIRVKK